MDKKPFCTAPWVGIEIHDSGDVKTCCEGMISLGNIAKEPIQNIIDNDIHKKIKSDILLKEDSENCVKCLNRQKVSGEAPVMNHFNEYFPDINKGFQTITLHWSKLCNLTCIYCGEHYSTAWMRMNGKDDKLEIRNIYDLNVEKWLIEKTPQASLLLLGGEPLLMKQNVQLLSKISKDTNVSIVTNFAYDLESNPCFKTLLEFPTDKVQWNLSLENTGEKYEWIRAGASWTQVEDNINLLRTTKFAESINYMAVYGIFSAFDLFETYKKLYDLGVKKILLQNLNEFETLDIFSYPAPMLKLALEQLEKIVQWQKDNLHPDDLELYEIKNFDGVIDKLKELIASDHKGSVTKGLFNATIGKFDEISGKSFKDLWPDVYALVNKYC